MRQLMRNRPLAMPLALMITAALLLAMSTTAAAKGEKKTLDGVLEGLSWGMTHEEVIKHLEAKSMSQYDVEAADVTDIGKKDRLRKKFRDKAQLVGKSYKEFKSADRSGFEVSIVADEFVPDNQESVLVIREDIAKKYYFFHADKLYKISIAYEPSYIGGLAFDSFVSAVSGKYGKAKKEGFDEEEMLNMVTWEDGASTRLRVDDKSSVFNTFLMSFTNPALEKNVASKHEAAHKARNTGPVVSAEIDNLTGDDDYSDGSAADAILGTNTQVDLKAGLPQEDIDAMEEESVADGKNTGDKGGTSKKKKDAKKRRRRGKSFGDLEKKKDDLIIY